MSQLEFQHYWRCAHHLSALENFEAKRSTCEFECHCQPLRWFDGGVHQLPQSWPAVRDRQGSLSATHYLL